MSNLPEKNLLEQIEELKRRLSALERAARLSSSSIGSGGLSVLDGGEINVKDDNDVTRVKLGQAGGEWDVSIYDSSGGNRIGLQDTLRGIEISSVSGYFSTYSTSWVDPGGSFPLITLDVGDSGRALVMFGALISSYANGGTGRRRTQVAYALSGANTSSPVVQGVVEVDFVGPAGDSIFISGSRAELITGLNAGSTTLDMRMRAVDVGSTPVPPAEAIDPWILAIPL